MEKIDKKDLVFSLSADARRKVAEAWIRENLFVFENLEKVVEGTLRDLLLKILPSDSAASTEQSGIQKDVAKEIYSILTAASKPAK